MPWCVSRRCLDHDHCLLFLLFNTSPGTRYTFFFFHTSTFQLLNKPWSQVSSLSSPRFLPSIFIAHRVQQSRCSSNFHRVLLTHTLAFPANQFVHKKMSARICASMHSGESELTKPTYTRLEDNLMRHRGDRLHVSC